MGLWVSLAQRRPEARRPGKKLSDPGLYLGLEAKGQVCLLPESPQPAAPTARLPPGEQLLCAPGPGPAPLQPGVLSVLSPQPGPRGPWEAISCYLLRGPHRADLLGAALRGREWVTLGPASPPLGSSDRRCPAEEWHQGPDSVSAGAEGAGSRATCPGAGQVALLLLVASGLPGGQVASLEVWAGGSDPLVVSIHQLDLDLRLWFLGPLSPTTAHSRTQKRVL